MVSTDRLRDLLSYDPLTGIFLWKVQRQRIMPGTVAGSVNKNGYRFIEIDGVSYRAHRLAFQIMKGYPPTRDIDHENGRRDDNWWENLREATESQNALNSKRRINNGSGYKGVIPRKGNKFQAKIVIDGRKVHLGTFDTAQDAHAAYLQAAAEAVGEFASGG